MAEIITVTHKCDVCGTQSKAELFEYWSELRGQIDLIIATQSKIPD